MSYFSIAYEPKACDNEEKSAEVFMKFAEECLHVSVTQFNRSSLYNASVYNF